MAASSPHVSVTRMPYSVRSPAEGAAAAAAPNGCLLSPSATGRGLDTQAPAPYRVPETHVALPFAPSPALVASLAAPAHRGGAQAGRR